MRSAEDLTENLSVDTPVVCSRDAVAVLDTILITSFSEIMQQL